MSPWKFIQIVACAYVNILFLFVAKLYSRSMRSLRYLPTERHLNYYHFGASNNNVSIDICEQVFSVQLSVINA